ncbi:MAG: glycosyltransferase [bacterium]
MEKKDSGEGQIRVLQLIAPATLGGAERVVLSIQESIGRGGEEESHFTSSLGIFIWVRRPDNVFLRQVRDHRYPHIVFPMRFTFDWANLAQLFRYLKAERIHLLHTHGYRSDIVGLLCARAARIPVITTLHGWTATDRKVQGYEGIQRRILPFFDAIIAVSEEIKDRLIRQRGIKPGKIRVLQNAVRIPLGEEDRASPLAAGRVVAAGRQHTRRQFGCDPDALVIGFVGRLSPEKNPADLLTVVSLLIPRLPKLVCWIVGEGPLRPYLERQAGELGIARQVCFLGFQADMGSIYQALDVLAITSRTEGTPLALLEAMAFGLPVVSMRVGGVGALLEQGIDGLLVNPGDMAGMAESLARVLTDPLLAGKLGSAARKKIRARFAVDGWIKKIQEVYGECLGKKPDPN